MINDKGILIRNIYYMLSYAFQELRKNNYDEISKEDFEYIQDLFAEILYKGISYQLKQGLYREYIERKDTLSVLKGKLDIQGTIRNRIRRKNTLSCEYDDLSEDNIFNQILKTTAGILIREKAVGSKRKNQLKSLMPFFDGVTEIDPFNIHWNMLRFQRNNQTYKMATFSDDHMNRLFEKFVLEYYRHHFPKLSAYPDQISWDITDRDTAAIDFLPTMKTDITLHNGDCTLIIDTKYYGRMMQEQFDKQTIHSGNLYQIFTYVKNLDKDNTGNVSGMLLYARTQEEIAPDLDATFGKNRIMVRTLDLNCDFPAIQEQLRNIAAVLDS